MEFELVKEKLHDYIEHGDHNKIVAMYLLLNEDISTRGIVYDEETLNILETRRDDMVSGKDKTYTLQQTVERLQKYRNQHGI